VSAQVVFFYLYAAVAVAGAIGLVMAKDLVHAVMSMFATLCAIAALYLVIGSEFLAAMQLFVYGGAITVLVLFVLMLTRRGAEERSVEASNRSTGHWIAGALCLVLFAVFVNTFMSSEWSIAPSEAHTTASLATILFSRYVLPFEIAGLALTVALIGAIVLAREDDLLDLETPSADAADEPASEAALTETAGEHA
jgi:NADH-quinone oxidoreductase subunit J